MPQLRLGKVKKVNDKKIFFKKKRLNIDTHNLLDGSQEAYTEQKKIQPQTVTYHRIPFL